jgi:hypothetical protein
MREKLSAMIDGMLSPDEIKVIEKHLAICPACAAAFEDLRKVVTHLQELEQVEPPPWMTQKVMAKVRSLDTAREKKGFFSWLFQPSFLKFPVGALATVILALTTYFIFEGIITDMPVKKTAPVEESRKQAPADKAKSAPSTLPTKPADSFRPAEKAIESGPSAEKAPAPKMVPPQRTSMDDSGKKDKMENRLWQEEPIRSRAEVWPPSAPKREYRAAPPVVASAPSAAGEVERKEMGSARMSKKAGVAGMSAQSQYDKAGSAPEEYAHRNAKKTLSFASEKSMLSFHIVADDPVSAAAQIMASMKEFKGKNIRKEIAGNKTIVKCEMNTAWLDRFFYRLKESGAVREKKAPPFTRDGIILITVEIVAGY